MTLVRKSLMHVSVALGFLGAAMVIQSTTASTFVIETETGPIKAKIITKGLSRPWALAFLPDGTQLVTERTGQLRVIKNGKLLSSPVSGLPPIAVGGQGGLLDVAVSGDFQTSGHIFLTFSKPDEGNNIGTALWRARLTESSGRYSLDEGTLLYSMKKTTSLERHFGSRIAIAKDGALFVTTGDRGESERSQDMSDTAGAVLRIFPDGSVPADNPHFGDDAFDPLIWSKGHRNPQGAAIDPATGDLWTVEHGARGGDEINRPLAGRNYGWPTIAYGRHYFGGKIGVGTKKDGLEQPLYYWDPSIAPSGLAFYDGAQIPAWRGNLLVGALKFQMLVRLTLKDGQIVGEERLFKRRFGRVRDVRVGPNGAVWLLTDANDGMLIRLTGGS